MKKLISSLLSLFLACGFAVPAAADIVNRQTSPIDLDSTWMPSGLDIEFVEVADDTRDDSVIVFFVYMRGWVSRYSFASYKTDFVSLTIDSNNDGTDDFFLSTRDETYPSGRASLDIGVLDLNSGNLASGCEGRTWMNDGYSDSDSNWIGFKVKRDCLNLSPNASVYAYSKYLNTYFDVTDDFVFETGVVREVSPAFGLPTKPNQTVYRTETPGSAPEDLVALSPEILKSVFQVWCADGAGSGWAAEVELNARQKAAGFKTVVITNNHVIEDCVRDGTVRLVDSNGASHTGTIFANDTANDLAGVLIKAEFPTLEWAGDAPGQGWWVGVLGSPLFIYGYLTTGIVSLLSGEILAVSAAVNGGNSGGPAFDRTGRVVGVVTSKLVAVDIEGFAFAHGAPLLCVRIVSCASESQIWSSKAVDVVDDEVGEVVEGGMLVQRAGSQVFVTSADLQGDFEIYEDGELIDGFTFDGVNQAHIVEQRVTGGIQIRQIDNGVASLVTYDFTKSLLWFQNVNLGSFSETNLGSSAREKVSNLVNHRYLESGSWKQRDSEVTKFICTGIYREGGSAAEKLSARKKAKLACESAKSLDNDPNSQVSFFYQTKTTKAASYVGKVLVTVKGIEPIVASRIN